MVREKGPWPKCIFRSLLQFPVLWICQNDNFINTAYVFSAAGFVDASKVAQWCQLNSMTSQTTGKSHVCSSAYPDWQQKKNPKALYCYPCEGNIIDTHLGIPLKRANYPSSFSVSLCDHGFKELQIQLLFSICHCLVNKPHLLISIISTREYAKHFGLA